jgi:NAD(P)H-dependent FMN reductase
MKPILGLSGSLRVGSFNTALLRAAHKRFPDRITVGRMQGIPLYNADVEAAGVPEPVLQLKQQLIDASGLLLVSPEYNNSVPGVVKNTIDWLSRPSLEVRNVFHGKCVAVIGASPGRFGTILGQNAWLTVFRALGARFYTGHRLMVSGAGNVFDEAGELADDSIKHRLEQFVEEFGKFCEL